MLEFIYSIMPGVAAMSNIHPMIVHFPIAFLNGFLLMEVIGFLLKREQFGVAARWMLYLGTLGAAAAVAAGLRAEDTLAHNEAIHEILTTHEALGVTVLIMALVLSVWRLFRERRFKAPERVAHMVVAAVMLAVMAFGADLGGLMVYKHGAGVQAVPMAEGHEHKGGGGHNSDAASGTVPDHAADGHADGEGGDGHHPSGVAGAEHDAGDSHAHGE